MFTETLNYATGSKDKLAIFDGNILIAAQSNPDENHTKTMVTFKRVIRPTDKEIGDYSLKGEFDHIEGYAFHFNSVESVNVLLECLQEVKASMLNHNIVYKME